MGFILKGNEIKFGALLSYISIIVTIAVTFVYTPIMLRLLGQSEYGLYSLIGSVVGYLSVLDIGLGNAIVRYISRNRALGDQKTEANLNGMFLVLYSVIGILSVVIGLILYFNLNSIFGASLSYDEIQKAKVMMILLVFNFAISFPLGVFGSIMQAYERFIFLRIVAIVRSICNPLFIVPILFLGYGSISMVVINTMMNIICLLINVIYCFKVLKIKIKFGKFDLKLLKEIALYSFFIFLSIIVDKVYWNTGQFILGSVSGTALVAIYAIAMQLTNMYMMFSTSVSGVLLPKISMMVANNTKSEDFSELFVKVGRLQYIIMAYIISGFTLFGKQFLEIWAGENYGDAYFIVLLIFIPLTIPLIQNVGVSILQARNLHKFRSVMLVLIAFLNIVISIPLARNYGGYGCAIATALSLLIGNVFIMNYYYKHKINLNITLFWRNIFSMSTSVLIALILGYGLHFLMPNNSYIFVGLKAIVFTFIYFTIMWLWSFNKYEKSTITNVIKIVLRKKISIGVK